MSRFKQLPKLPSSEPQSHVKTPVVQKVNVRKTPFFTKDLVKCVVVLAGIALIASLLLGVMNWLTYVDPNETVMKEVALFYGMELDSVSLDEGLSAQENINACFVAKSGDNVIGYCFYAVGTGAKDGTMELLVYIDSDGIIKEIEVYAQGETAGYFDKVEKANKSKYIGLDAGEVVLKLIGSKDSPTSVGDVNAVSGATYTSKGYHNAVTAAVNAYKSALVSVAEVE